MLARERKILLTRSFLYFKYLVLLLPYYIEVMAGSSMEVPLPILWLRKTADKLEATDTIVSLALLC
jgi:hypothetical protein